ncbi:TetR/AcrR family transcriptional regulator [Roseomonas eburnea]|uniref:TetR/AcrR family transcriptional regulator n=1 Tax=Neoroseomonas eburnea TaxID=1346889 RepID=A0A9X9XF15_9PROT|nr:TetR/AcrR family transcriptional regulator [Neoroseomonas eburnea]MBR0682301.1 TetR/AcrR family transcriptional regulator [Neoroseomonas eburnea]
MDTTNPRRRRKQARPAELLAAALDTFRDKGFATTRMEDIAARAGVSKGTIYLYYPSKQAVFEALVRESILPNLARLEAIQAAASGSCADRLRLFVRSLAEATADARIFAIPKLVLTEAGNFPELARFYRQEVVARGLAMVAGLLEEGMRRGEFRQVDAGLAARLFIGPVMLAALWRSTFGAIEETPLPSGAMLDLHLDLFLRGIAAEAQP